MQFPSQNGQDKFVANLFKNYKKPGFFLDVGAYDGRYYSNTYMFEKDLHWKGICIEPNPSVFEKLKANRECTLLNCCIAEKVGAVEFLSVDGYGEMLSGMTKFFDNYHYDRIDKIIEAHGGCKTVIEIPASPLKDIFNQYSVTEIDYCNIDVEGSEMDVLKSIDFSKIFIKVFTIENNNRTDEIRKFLSPRGYKFLWRLGSDEVYEYHSKRFDLMVLWKLEKVKNKFSLFGKAFKRRIFKSVK